MPKRAQGGMIHSAPVLVNDCGYLLSAREAEAVGEGLLKRINDEKPEEPRWMSLPR